MPAGYYGKLPMRGDFIQRNISTDFTYTWDNWLQSVLSASNHNLGHQWLNYYLVSPSWRYLIPQKSQSYQLGVMLPSVDKVGRYFPFTVSTNIIPESDASHVIMKNRSWFDAAESIAMQALNDTITYDQLNQMTQELEVENNTPVMLRGGRVNFRIPIDQFSSLNNALDESRQHQPSQPAFDLSYWWNEGNNEITGSLICCQGMPDDNIYTAMLDGKWSLCHIETKDNNQFL